MSKKYAYIDWYCDGCDANLNRQNGFTTSMGSWTCVECGYVNDVTEDNIIDEDEETFETRCPNCDGHMRRDVYCVSDVWICEDCGTEAEKDDYGLLWVENNEYEYDEEE